MVQKFTKEYIKMRDDKKRIANNARYRRKLRTDPVFREKEKARKRDYRKRLKLRRDVL